MVNSDQTVSNKALLIRFSEFKHSTDEEKASVIATDKMLFSSEKCPYLSYFSMKTYVVVLIRSASLRCF